MAANDAQTTVVKLPVQSKYAMPTMCCACESTIGPFVSHLSASGKSRKWEIKLSFPLCPQCEEGRKAISYEQGLMGAAVVAFLVIASSVLCFLGNRGVLALEQIAPIAGIGGFCVLPLIIFISIPISSSMTIKKVGEQVYDVGKKTSEAVKVKKYKSGGIFSDSELVLEFASKKFGVLFEQMNVTEKEERF